MTITQTDNDNLGASWKNLHTVTGKPWPGVQYFCTTRQGGQSLPPYDSMNMGLHTGDDPVAVGQNRARLQRLLPGPVVWLEQVHGTDVHDVDQAGENAFPVTADAAVTTQTNKVLAIMTADCLPVVLASENGEVIGAAHAGWRGLLNGVLENTLGKMRCKTRESNFRAWIGPAIGFEAFEVGQEVYDAFMNNDENQALYFRSHPHHPGKWLADLSALAVYRLQKNGVNVVEESELCTFMNHDRFFSYRRQNRTGRMVTVAWKIKLPA
ncbi:peptidoglycan editing factor PgeF [Advenella sp. RU8]|uniref:peptidoglycan editing factor PgeF n=1 Tax=Advenella sp. RU8 TaxID=3399575 RepID=UPI003AAA29E8